MLQRAITILIGAPLFLALVLLNPWICTLVVAVLMLVALREFYGGCRQAGYRPADGWGHAAALVLLGSSVPLLDPAGDGPSPFPFPGPRSAALFFAGLTLLVMAS